MVVTGGRNYADNATIFNVIRWLDPTDIFEGGASGLDALARIAGKALGIRVHTDPADWARFGAAAGRKRNQEMLEEAYECAEASEKPLLLVSFPGGAGTRDCTDRAKAMSIPVLIVSSTINPYYW